MGDGKRTDGKGWPKRVGWFGLYWLASVAALSVIAWLIRLAIL
ncbi:MAG: DUF2474 domain-containing protein [Rhizobiaceae bacterium]